VSDGACENFTLEQAHPARELGWECRVFVETGKRVIHANCEVI
jgi:hypothetical protein